MVLAKCGLCQKTIHGKSRKLGKFLDEATHYAKSVALEVEITSGSSICSKCRLKVSKETILRILRSELLI